MPYLDWMLKKTLLYSCIILWSHCAISKSSAIGKRLLQNALTSSWASSANWGNTSDLFLGEQNSESEPWYNICSQNRAQNHDIQAWLPLRGLWERCGPTAKSSHFIPSKQHNVNLGNVGFFFSNVPKNSFQVCASRGVDTRVRQVQVSSLFYLESCDQIYVYELPFPKCLRWCQYYTPHGFLWGLKNIH